MLIDTLTGSRAPAATILIRILVGGVFLSEGIQKFLFPNALGVVGLQRSEYRPLELWLPLLERLRSYLARSS